MYRYVPCTYMFMTVCKLVNMYIHVCTMFRHVCTNLPILVQVVRIPDDSCTAEDRTWQTTAKLHTAGPNIPDRDI